MNSVIKNKRAVSPVIATVILVAVAITVSVAVAYWMSGIAGTFTKFEKVEIQSDYSPKFGTDGDWNVTLVLKNSGSANSTLLNAFVNGKPISSFSPVITWHYSTSTVSYTLVPVAGITLGSGQSMTVYLTVDHTHSTSGTSLDIKLHSAGGMDYIRLVPLT